jgi:hypothetical protein
MKPLNQLPLPQKRISFLSLTFGGDGNSNRLLVFFTPHYKVQGEGTRLLLLICEKK